MAGGLVLTSKVPPPQGRTVMVRCGGSVFSAALRRFGGWALIHGSGETSMSNPPEEWWLDDALAREMLNCLLPVAEGGQATLSGSLVAAWAGAPGAGKIKICFEL